MTDESTLPKDHIRTLRGAVKYIISCGRDGGWETDKTLNLICDELEDTGSPAHMRVAAELRGE